MMEVVNWIARIREEMKVIRREDRESGKLNKAVDLNWMSRGESLRRKLVSVIILYYAVT